MAPTRVLAADRYPVPDFGAVIQQLTASFAANGPLAAVDGRSHGIQVRSRKQRDRPS